MMNMIEFIKNNFWHVAPILGVGFAAVWIFWDRLQALMWIYPMKSPTVFYDKLRDLIMSDRLAEAIALCDQYKRKPVAKVVREGLLRAHQPEAMIEDGLVLAVSSAHQELQKRTPFLATIANVATLLGLLGTIVGLIASFEAVGNASAQQRSALLAAGISTAMNATMMGLGVAIPCMLAFSFLTNRVNRMVADIDQSAVKTLDLLKQRFYAAEYEAAPAEQFKKGA